MASLKKNTAGQHIKFGLTNATTGAPLTGASPSGGVTLDGGTQTACVGVFTELGLGQYDYAPTQGETNGINGGYAFTATNAVGPVNYNVYFDTVDANGLVQVDVADWNGTAVATPATAGIPDVNVTEINGSSTAAENMAIASIDVGRGQCAAGGTTTTIPTSVWTIGGAGNAADQFVGRVILFDYDTATPSLQGQAAVITANTAGATPEFTVANTALTTAPAAGDTFSVF